jgi:hypothetical protein
MVTGGPDKLSIKLFFPRRLLSSLAVEVVVVEVVVVEVVVVEVVVVELVVERRSGKSRRGEKEVWKASEMNGGTPIQSYSHALYTLIQPCTIHANIAMHHTAYTRSIQ